MSTNRADSEKHNLWLRFEGSQCKIRVDGLPTAERVREGLMSDFNGSEVHQLPGSDEVFFLVYLESREQFADLERAITSMDGIEMMLEPA